MTIQKTETKPTAKMFFDVLRLYGGFQSMGVLLFIILFLLRCSQINYPARLWKAPYIRGFTTLGQPRSPQNKTHPSKFDGQRAGKDPSTKPGHCLTVDDEDHRGHHWFALYMV
jgi:hypothetical protein